MLRDMTRRERLLAFLEGYGSVLDLSGGTSPRFARRAPGSLRDDMQRIASDGSLVQRDFALSFERATRTHRNP